jgi:selenocysteine lyase/cysteine desulfurase
MLTRIPGAARRAQRGAPQTQDPCGELEKVAVRQAHHCAGPYPARALYRLPETQSARAASRRAQFRLCIFSYAICGVLVKKQGVKNKDWSWG